MYIEEFWSWKGSHSLIFTSTNNAGWCCVVQSSPGWRKAPHVSFKCDLKALTSLDSGYPAWAETNAGEESVIYGVDCSLLRGIGSCAPLHDGWWHIQRRHYVFQKNWRNLKVLTKEKGLMFEKIVNLGLNIMKWTLLSNIIWYSILYYSYDSDGKK